MSVWLLCGCCNNVLCGRWLNKTQVYSLTVPEAKRSEIKVSAGPLLLEARGDTLFLALSSSGCSQHLLTCSGVNPQSLHPHITVCTPICQACLGPALMNMDL